jgi:hypothetical protein
MAKKEGTPMNKSIYVLLLIASIGISGCAMTGKTKTHYGGDVKLPKHGNYTSPSEIPVVPLPGECKTELPLEALTKKYYVSYSDLFTQSLKALKNAQYTVMSFNSSSGIIEFKNLSGKVYYLRLSPDQEFNSRSIARIQAPDGSRRIDSTFVENIFSAIDFQISNM